MMTDERLAEIESRFPLYSTGYDEYSAIKELIAEVRRLREQVEGHAERIAAQSELLNRSAESSPSWTSEPPKVPWWY
jgi:hypothetical protein